MCLGPSRCSGLWPGHYTADSNMRGTASAAVRRSAHVAIPASGATRSVIAAISSSVVPRQPIPWCETPESRLCGLAKREWGDAWPCFPFPFPALQAYAAGDRIWLWCRSFFLRARWSSGSSGTVPSPNPSPNPSPVSPNPNPNPSPNPSPNGKTSR